MGTLLATEEKKEGNEKAEKYRPLSVSTKVQAFVLDPPPEEGGREKEKLKIETPSEVKILHLSL